MITKLQITVQNSEYASKILRFKGFENTEVTVKPVFRPFAGSIFKYKEQSATVRTHNTRPKNSPKRAVEMSQMFEAESPADISLSGFRPKVSQ